jgi:hypothetical protein
MQWRPYAPKSKIFQVYTNIPCRPCITRTCVHKKCLKEIYPEHITDILGEITGKYETVTIL